VFGAGGAMMRWIRWFSEVGLTDVPLVGGKNASLGEMRRTLGALAPDGRDARRILRA
jgi:phosphoenolpyruvate synthase/pyruvate phosphate dikinase